jgi:tRNA pseudouridine13 synthase
LRAVPDHWRTAGLEPIRAFDQLPVTGRLRATPEDFAVEERLGFEPDGDGAHLLLKVRKRGANTEWVARMLARHAGAAVRDVGFAGLKDRHAIAEQWFSVPAGAAQPESWLELRDAEFAVVAVHRHRRKLRRGALAGNRFRIRVRELRGELQAIAARVEVIRSRGVPNYFGIQRFGIDGSNLRALAEWTFEGRELRARSARSFTLSAGRSLLFNAVLAERVGQATWDRLEPGDVANLDGSGSIFDVGALTPELEQRCLGLDIHPTGPLWGSGQLRVSGAVAELETAVAERFEAVGGALAGAGLEQERRSLRLRVDGLEAHWIEDTLELVFGLGPGEFATAVLRELGEFSTQGGQA